jgi:hypothetical protein
MPDRDDGGPAFPHVNRFYWGGDERYDGLSLRDWFAGLALQGLCSLDDAKGDADQYAKWAYQYADAMLAERKR